MQTFKLWLENDPDIPGFKILAYEKVDVGIKDVIENGIHPCSYRNANRTLTENIVRLINTDELKIKELTDLNYCDNISNCSGSYYYSRYDQFEELLKRISQCTRFVENLSYLELIGFAKELLSEKWNHEIAKKLANQAYYGFNQIRSFIKSKNKKLKLASYDDLNKYDLGEILKLKDFENNDKLIISEGLPATNFRSIDFINKVTDSRRLLKLTDRIDQFELQPAESSMPNSYAKLIYNGHWKDGIITLTPILNDDPEMRFKARFIAEKWRQNQGRYCFAIDIKRLTEMLENDQFKILFPRLDYKHKREPAQSTAAIQNKEIPKYAVGGFPTTRVTGDTIKSILRNNSVSMTGTKDQLLEKLAKLAVKLYRKHKPEISQYFIHNHFIKIPPKHNQTNQHFQILQELDLRNLILTMYIIRHLRANTILNPEHENNTFDLQPLAQSLIKEEIGLSSQFLQVQN